MKKRTIVVGAGLSGATVARVLADQGYEVEVIEKREVGGHCADYFMEEILIHANGIHVWHNSDVQVQKFVERFTEFSGYTHKAKSMYKAEVYTFPPNLETLCKVYGKHHLTTAEAKALDLTELRNRLFRGYIKKQWGQEPPQWVIDRIPIHYSYSDRYFNDTWEGIPIRGYKDMIENMLDGIPVSFEEYEYSNGYTVVHTGPIDEYYEYKFGPLSYRSMRFEHTRLDLPDWQGVAQLNYPSEDISFTKVIEHKHFQWPANIEKLPYTYITKEYPGPWEPGKDRHYPMFDNELYEKYAALAKKDGIHFLGRLGRYRYLNMNQAVREALDLAYSLVNDNA